MKNVTAGICFVVVLLLGGSSVSAQMGGMQHGPMVEHGVMEHGRMMDDMTGMANRMSEMMEQMSGIMRGMPPGNMKNISRIMKDMSQQMMEMSRVMAKGTVSMREMKRMQDSMLDIQNKLSSAERHR